MRVVAADAEAVREAAELLRAGEVVAIPTETVYGLAAVAVDAAAVAKVFRAKERPTFDPLIVHLGDPDLAVAVDVGRLGPAARAAADRLAAAFWPGPLTLVLPRGARVPDLVTSGLDTVAVRMPRHPVALAVIRATGAPLAAPSANRFGRISPTSAADVVAELEGRVGLVLDGGPCTVGVESTVVAIGPGGELTLLRPGGVAPEAIERVAGAPLARAGTSPASPGMLPTHYAPRKPLRLLDRPVAALARAPDAGDARTLGLLAFCDESAGAALAALAGRGVIARVLSASADVDEAARGLFAALRALDASEAEILYAEPVPGGGLGHAIRDRLARAAGG
ncbi:MAG TPA: L-threonylcarbamoyladenylate synthase [Haliangiales bacterium]|nr:L-threonylcarbamoyladenylate synthase [Haliangiales bacterium]